MKNWSKIRLNSLNLVIEFNIKTPIFNFEFKIKIIIENILKYHILNCYYCLAKMSYFFKKHVYVYILISLQNIIIFNFI